MTNNRSQQQQQTTGPGPQGQPAPPPPPPPLQPPLALPRRTVDLRIPAIEKYAYCLCLHVKPATIFIAIFKLVRSLLFASILLNNEIAYNDHSELAAFDERHRSTVIAVSIFSRIIIASVAALAIYAVMYNRAALLMPLYAVLLVDFFFALPVAYNRDVDNPNVPQGLDDLKGIGVGMGRENHLSRYSTVLLSTSAMIARIYFLCVIWKCYRYLRLIELVTPIRFTDVYPHITQHNIQFPIVRVLGSADSIDLNPACGGGGVLAPPSYDSIASSMKPPNYEEAIKSDANVNLAGNEGQQTPTHTVLDITQPSSPTQSASYEIQANQNQQQGSYNNVAVITTNQTTTNDTTNLTTPVEIHHSNNNQQTSNSNDQQNLQQQNSPSQHQRIASNQIVPATDPNSEYISLPTPQRLSSDRKGNDQ